MSPHIRTTGAIVAAYVANNHLHASEIDKVLHEVHAKITDIAAKDPRPFRHGGDASAMPGEGDPAHDALTCLECGKQFKSLKLHLRRSHRLSAEDYKARHALPRHFCFISLDYSVERSKIVSSFKSGRFLTSQN